ncbi:MAG: sodium:calcium antiporter [Thermoleophilia bacterium]
MAAEFGISQVVIGLTVIAVGTSLPELATSVTSALRDEADVAFGNVIGSNILNVLAVLGVVALIHPFEMNGLRPLDLGVMVASAALLLPLMWRGLSPEPLGGGRSARRLCSIYLFACAVGGRVGLLIQLPQRSLPGP